MRLVIHQAIKDLRVVRWYVAAWLTALAACHAFFLIVAAQASVTSEAANRLDIAETTLAVAASAALVVLAALLAQKDSPVATDAFWLTRPVPGWRILLSKLLIAVVLLVVAPVAADLLCFAAVGLPLRAFPGYSLAVQCAWVLPILAVAAMTIGLAQFVLIGVFEIVLFVGVTAVLAALFPVPTPYPSPFLFWGAPGVTALVGLVLLAFLYLTRQKRVATVLLGIAPAAVACFVVFWPWPQRSVPSYSDSGLARPSFSIDRSSLALVTRGTLHTLHVPIIATGLPPGAWMWHTWQYDWWEGAWLDIEGRRVPLRYSPVEESLGPPMTEAGAFAHHLLAPVIGDAHVFNPRTRNVLGHRQVVLRFTVKADDFARISGRPATLHIELRPRIYQYTTVSRTRWAPGAAYDRPLSHGDVIDVRANAGSLIGDVRESTTQSLSYIGLFGPTFVLLNRASAQAVIGSEQRYPHFGGTFGATFNYLTLLRPLPQTAQVTWNALVFSLVDEANGEMGRDNASARIPDWQKNADLVVAMSRDLGELNTTVELRDVKLAEIPEALSRQPVPAGKSDK